MTTRSLSVAARTSRRESEAPEGRIQEPTSDAAPMAAPVVAPAPVPPRKRSRKQIALFAVALAAVYALLATAYSTNSAVPQLFITSSLGGASVTWPDKFSTWVLQSTTNLSSSAWQPVTACENNALVTNNGTSHFFRLMH